MATAVACDADAAEVRDSSCLRVERPKTNDSLSQHREELRSEKHSSREPPSRQSAFHSQRLPCPAYPRTKPPACPELHYVLNAPVALRAGRDKSSASFVGTNARGLFVELEPCAAITRAASSLPTVTMARARRCPVSPRTRAREAAHRPTESRCQRLSMSQLARSCRPPTPRRATP